MGKRLVFPPLFAVELSPCSHGPRVVVGVSVSSRLFLGLREPIADTTPLVAIRGINENEIARVRDSCLGRRSLRRLPDDRSEVTIATENFVEHAACSMDFGVVEVYPHGSVSRKELADLEQAVAHHRQPDRVLQRVVVVLERLLGVERRVEVDELDLADVLAGELRQLAEARERVERVAADQQVVRGTSCRTPFRRPRSGRAAAGPPRRGSRRGAPRCSRRPRPRAAAGACSSRSARGARCVPRPRRDRMPFVTSSPAFVLGRWHDCGERYSA